MSHDSKEARPYDCACIDVSEPPPGNGSAGVLHSPNLTFPSNNFLDNNNLPGARASHGTGKHSNSKALSGVFSRWRPSRQTPGEGEEASAVDSIDTKPFRGDDAESEDARRYVIAGGAEFFATALLMFVGCAGAYVELTKLAANVYGSSAFGFAVYMSTTIFGEVSGAHMNPLVTLINVVFGKMGWTMAVVYMTCQTAGALVGYGLLYWVVPADVQEAVQGGVANGGVCCTVPMESMTSLSAVLAEFIVTSILLSAVCAGLVRKDPAPAHVGAFQFGLLVAGICVVEASYTGASMNPSRSIATALWTGVWERFWVYVVAQILSTSFVIAIFAMFRQKEQKT